MRDQVGGEVFFVSGGHCPGNPTAAASGAMPPSGTVNSPAASATADQ